MGCVQSDPGLPTASTPRNRIARRMPNRPTLSPPWPPNPWPLQGTCKPAVERGHPDYQPCVSASEQRELFHPWHHRVAVRIGIEPNQGKGDGSGARALPPAPFRRPRALVQRVHNLTLWIAARRNRATNGVTIGGPVFYAPRTKTQPRPGRY